MQTFGRVRIMLAAALAAVSIAALAVSTAYAATSHGPHAFPSAAVRSAGVRALNDIPNAIDQPTMPFSVNGSLPSVNQDAVYAVHLTAGHVYWFWLNGPAAPSDFDLYLYPPSATTVADPEKDVAESVTNGSQEWIVFDANQTGTYYLDAWSYKGAGSFTVHGDLMLNQDPDSDVGPGLISEPSAPFTATDTLTQGSDVSDTYKLWLDAGQSVKLFMTGPTGTHFYTGVFSPECSATTTWAEDSEGIVRAGSTTRYESIFCTAYESGYYYPQVGFFAPSLGGGYTLSATTRDTNFPTSLTIKTNFTSVKYPKPFELSGVLANGMMKDKCVVEVKKPGKAYWSYSSARLVYSISATSGGSWWYRYTPNLKGTYAFRVRYTTDGYSGRASTLSKIIYVTVKR